MRPRGRRRPRRPPEKAAAGWRLNWRSITAWSERMEEQIAASPADPDPRRCSAITTKGSQCKLPAGPGDTKCAIHGGRAHL